MGEQRREECGNTDTDIMIKPDSYTGIFFLHVPFRNTVRDMTLIYHNNTEVDNQTEDWF